MDNHLVGGSGGESVLLAANHRGSNPSMFRTLYRDQKYNVWLACQKNFYIFLLFIDQDHDGLRKSSKIPSAQTSRS